MFIASDDIASWSSDNYYMIMDDQLSCNSDDFGFNDKVKKALMIHDDIAMMSFGVDDEKSGSEEKENDPNRNDNNPIAFFDNADENNEEEESKEESINVRIERVDDQNEENEDKLSSDEDMIHSSNMYEVAARMIMRSERVGDISSRWT